MLTNVTVGLASYRAMVSSYSVHTSMWGCPCECEATSNRSDNHRHIVPTLRQFTDTIQYNDCHRARKQRCLRLRPRAGWFPRSHRLLGDVVRTMQSHLSCLREVRSILLNLSYCNLLSSLSTIHLPLCHCIYLPHHIVTFQKHNILTNRQIIRRLSSRQLLQARH